MKKYDNYSEEEVMYMLELIYIVDEKYDIEWLSLEDRFEATRDMYYEFEKIYTSESGEEEFGYRSEIYNSRYTDDIVKKVLSVLNIDFVKKSLLLTRIDLQNAWENSTETMQYWYEYILETLLSEERIDDKVFASKISITNNLKQLEVIREYAELYEFDFLNKKGESIL